ncbi:MAG: hypothetical protein HY648_07250 [Acidobacteria bacterium]|nr:hypothetical protein [Acidobacteriota bacterium]
MDATWKFQRAVWAYSTFHRPVDGFRAVDPKEERDAEQKFSDGIKEALQPFTKTYDLPFNIREIWKKEIEIINLEYLNLIAFSMTGQTTEIEKAASKIQRACEAIRVVGEENAHGWFKYFRNF